MSAFDLSDKVAVVTGGNSGIGLGLVRGLLEAGARVEFWGTSPEKNAAALDSLGGLAARAQSALVDVADESAVVPAMVGVVERWGRLDSCFANAGTTNQFGAPSFVDSSLDEWRAMTRVNLDGTYLVLREAARHMRDGHGGSLVATGSLASQFGAPREQAYAASKAGVEAMIRGLAVELARHGIRANALLPGWTMSPQFAPWLKHSAASERIMARIPLRRWGAAEDWGAIAVYLASDGSRFHTGDTFRIDGGYGVF